MSEWQLVTDNVPKNSAVIAWDGKRVGEACFIEYEDLSGWYWGDEQYAMAYAPTHWIPFPEPPKD